ncbi:MAG TPA: nuclear pore complex subunit [Cytophagales bacterium]|nr:nuclear pore complex subunit [Cytophagales bacterium]HAA18844.1 nuclear pore complex subunit [Cytophagales bacterium]HAP60879.1 nuclear pore complex subunit [Cytophagales bacterium]
MYTAKGTESSPEIHLDFQKGLFRISGKSIPENPWEVYQPILDHLAEYQKAPISDTILEIELEFFNTSSSKMLLDIINELEKIHAANKSNVLIKWMYNDEDMMEVGEDFKYLLSVPFELINVS